MEENIADTFQKASEALHWLGQHRVANALMYCGRLARALNLHGLDDFAEFVEAMENGGAEVDDLRHRLAFADDEMRPLRLIAHLAVGILEAGFLDAWPDTRGDLERLLGEWKSR